jgi:putative PIN family toxin of toxin-antitoxin system
MKLVLDTNIFISSFYWGGNPEKIIQRIIDGVDELYISKEILEEISSVMARPKFKTQRETIESFTKSIDKISKKIVIMGQVKNICRDSEDDNKLECGLLSNADYIITGDDDLLVLKEYANIKIIKPKEYLEIVDIDI